MSFDFRIKLWALCMGNLLVIMLFQKVTGSDMIAVYMQLRLLFGMFWQLSHRMHSMPC